MGMESFVAASDLHGDRQDDGAVQLFKKFVNEYKPKWRIFMGDIWDFRAIREGASKDEKRHSLRTDFDKGMAFLKWYKPQVITLGNHDARMFDLVHKEGIEKSGPLSDLGQIFIEEFEALAGKLKIKVLPYDKRRGVWKQNDLKFTHGFSAGKNAASEMAGVYGNILFGHGHAIDVASEPGETPRVARMVGCLCRLDMSYNRAQMATLRQQHGWAYGAFLPHNRNEVFQASVENDQVVYAERLKVINAA